VIPKILRPFDEKIKFRKLFLYWFFFFSVGIFLMLVITPLSPSFIESEKEIVANFCTPINLIFVAGAFLIETLLFMILPWKIFGKRGLIIGLSIWAIFHLISSNFPIFIYISIMAFFYYKCLEIGRWKEIFLFHFIINIPGLISCLFK